MVDLRDVSSLNISFDDRKENLVYGEDVSCAEHKSIKLESLRPTLLNKSLNYPEDVYHEYSNVRYLVDHHLEGNNISYDIFFLPAGLLGIEFVKSHVYFTPIVSQGASCLVEVQLGTLTVILQRNAPRSEFDYETHVEEGMIIKIAQGERAAIPNGYFYTFVNAEEVPVIFVRIYRNHGHINYELIRRERGLAYYAIRKNARQEIVLNPLYRDTPRIREMEHWELFDKLRLRRELALYQQLREEVEMVMECLVN